MRYYLYVADPEGREIPGSRRSLANCRSREAYARLRDELRRVSGDECDVRDNIADWRQFWADRE